MAETAAERKRRELFQARAQRAKAEQVALGKRAAKLAQQARAKKR